jgi:hypothetical protein
MHPPQQGQQRPDDNHFNRKFQPTHACSKLDSEPQANRFRERIGLERFVVLSDDKQLISYINDLGYSNNTAQVPHEWLIRHYQTTGDTTKSRLSGKSNVDLVNSKASIWYHLISLGLNFIYSDPDMVWLNKNTHTHLEYKYRYSFADIIFAQNPTSRRALLYSTGFFYARATPFVKDFFRRVVDKQLKNNEKSDFSDIAARSIQFIKSFFSVHAELREETDNFDQSAVNSILSETNFNDSRADKLDPLLYASGEVFFTKQLNRKFGIDPFIVHVNHLSSNEDKVEALKSANFWFLQKLKTNSSRFLI